MSSAVSLLWIDPSEVSDLRNLAYRRIRDAILSGRFPCESRINERRLAAEMGISTTPVKDALRRLEAEGLTVTLPRRGTFVTSAVDEKHDELTLIRHALEGVAACLAASKIKPKQAVQLKAAIRMMGRLTRSGDVGALVTANEQFHHLLHDIAANRYLRRVLHVLRDPDRTVSRRVLSDPDERFRAFAEHDAIAEAVLSKDPERADLIMRDHIRRSARVLAGTAPPNISHLSTSGS